MGHRRVKPLRDLERVCPRTAPPPLGLLILDDVEHVLERERLEVEAVGVS